MTRQRKMVAGYLRVSSRQQVENGQGLPSQKAAIEAYCKDRRWQVSAFYQDAGVSGDEDQRPGLLDLTAAVQAGEVDVVVLDRLDRLARKLLLQESVLQTWQGAGAEVVSLAEPDLGGQDEERVLFRQIMGAMNEFQKGVLLRRMKRGRLTKASRGGHAGGALPLGYRSNGRELRVLPEEAEVVTRILRARKQGHLTYRAIADKLNAEGAATKRGGKWYASTVRAGVLNPVYAGKIRYADVEATGKHKRIA